MCSSLKRFLFDQLSSLKRFAFIDLYKSAVIFTLWVWSTGADTHVSYSGGRITVLRDALHEEGR